MNAESEAKEVATAGHRDFYNVRKVDPNPNPHPNPNPNRNWKVDLVEATSAVNRKQLVRFIRRKAASCGSETVLAWPETGEKLTLEQVF